MNFHGRVKRCRYKNMKICYILNYVFHNRVSYSVFTVRNASQERQEVQQTNLFIFFFFVLPFILRERE